jgi:hypothetical protein
VYLAHLSTGEAPNDFSEIIMLVRPFAAAAHARSSITGTTVAWYAILGAGAMTLLVFYLVRQVRNKQQGQPGRAQERPLDIRLTNVMVDDDVVLLGYTRDDALGRIRSVLRFDCPKTFDTVLVHVGSRVPNAVPVLHHWEDEGAKLGLRLIDDGGSIELRHRETADSIALDQIPCPRSDAPRSDHTPPPVPGPSRPRLRRKR